MRKVPARAALVTAVERLRAAGIEGAARDARRLLAHALAVEPDRLAAVISDPVDAERFQRLIDRRAAREPVSRILGRREFYGRTFRITPGVLDPRPETELLVDLAFRAPFGSVLDLGTGSGCLIVTLLAERPEARGVAVDISDEALAVARQNAERAGVAERVRLVQGDWFAPVAGRFDLIVANPPYVSAAELPHLAPEVRLWDPPGALSDGGDGLSAHRSIAAAARDRLTPGGRLIVETGWRQSAAVAGLLRAAGLTEVAVHSDLSGHGRAVSGRHDG